MQPSAPAVRNPTIAVGAGLALLGSALILLGAFLPSHSYLNVPIAHNSFVSSGDWWVVAIAVLIAVSALYFMLGAGRGRGWQVILPSLLASAAGVYGLTNKYQRLTPNAAYQQLFGVSVVKATPGVGVFLVLAGGVIGVVGGMMLFVTTGDERNY
jgi:hypothetical protein